MPAPLSLSSGVRRAFERLGDDLARVFGPRLVAVVATGRTTSLGFVSSIEAGDLDATSALVETWQRDDLSVPLIVTPDEFRRSLDVFPLEYQAILDHHVVIVGTPPFDGVRIDGAALRRACEVQARGHLVHLRQGWIQAAGHHDELARLIAHSAAPLRALLVSVARLNQSSLDTPADGARLAGLPDALVSDVLALEHAPERAAALIPRLPEYLATAERLWTFVDEWQ